MCICVAADREGRIVARCINRAKPSADHIVEALGARIGESGVFLCDGATAYSKLIEEKKCEKIVLKSRDEYNKAYHLNTVNGLHSRLKTMYIGKQWKKPKTRVESLMKLGVPKERAWIAARTRKAYWRCAAMPIVQEGLSKEILARAGYYSIQTRYEQMHLCD